MTFEMDGGLDRLLMDAGFSLVGAVMRMRELAETPSDYVERRVAEELAKDPRALVVYLSRISPSEHYPDLDYMFTGFALSEEAYDPEKVDLKNLGIQRIVPITPFEIHRATHLDAEVMVKGQLQFRPRNLVLSFIKEHEGYKMDVYQFTDVDSC